MLLLNTDYDYVLYVGCQRSIIGTQRSFRGISQRLARHYLGNLGGEIESDDHVIGDNWGS